MQSPYRSLKKGPLGPWIFSYLKKEKLRHVFEDVMTDLLSILISA